MAGSRLRAGFAQALVVLALAVSMGAATYLASQASGDWHRAARRQTQWDAEMVEDVRNVYGVQAPAALALAESQAVASADDRVRKADVSPRADTDLLVDAIAQQRHDALLESSAGDNGAVMSEHTAGGPDPVAALAAARRGTLAATPDKVTQDVARGRRTADLALALSLLALPLVLVFFTWQAVQAVRRWLARQASSDAAADGEPEEGADVDLVPQPWAKDRSGYVGPLLKTGVWLLLVVVAPLQLWVTTQGDRSDAASSRLATQIAGQIQAQRYDRDFDRDARQQLNVLRGDAAERASLVSFQDDPTTTTPYQTALAQVQADTARRLTVVVHTMTQPPTVAAGVDAGTVRAMASSYRGWHALLVRQNNAGDLADGFGRSGQLLMLATLLLAVATTVLALAPIREQSRRFLLIAATAGLAGSAVAAYSVVLVVAALG